jgi:hypothetical protein
MTSALCCSDNLPALGLTIRTAGGREALIAQR